jgi:hypothetical protein
MKEKIKKIINQVFEEKRNNDFCLKILKFM